MVHISWYAYHHIMVYISSYHGTYIIISRYTYHHIMVHISPYHGTHITISWYTYHHIMVYFVHYFQTWWNDILGSCKIHTRNDKHHISAHICAIFVIVQLTLHDVYINFDATTKQKHQINQECNNSGHILQIFSYKLSESLRKTKTIY